MRQKIRRLFDVIKKLEESSARIAHESKSAADEASEGLTASYSAAGDAEHARNTANLSIGKHKIIKNLAKELNDGLDSDIPEKIETPCFIALKINGGEANYVYLVNNPI